MNIIYLLLVSILITSVAVQIYFREKYKGRLEWRKENMDVSYWRMILQLRNENRCVGNILIAAVIVQVVAACGFIVLINFG